MTPLSLEVVDIVTMKLVRSPLPLIGKASVFSVMEFLMVGGVSTTGHGEAITKVCLAYEVMEHMRAGKQFSFSSNNGTSYHDRNTLY